MKNKKVISFDKLTQPVLNCFIRVIKEHGLYYTFRQNFKGLDFCGLKKYNVNKNSAFYEVNSINDIVKTLNIIINSQQKLNMECDDVYDIITLLINNLLHFFIEPHGISYTTLSIIGEDVYILACNKLLGEPLDGFLENCYSRKEPEPVINSTSNICTLLGNAPLDNYIATSNSSAVDYFDETF